MLKRMLSVYLVFITLCNFVFICAEEVITLSSSDHVAECYVNGMFGKSIPAITQEDKEPTGFWAGWEKFKKTIEPKINILTARETQEMAFEIAKTNNFETTIVDNSFIDKLELIHGGENGNNNLFQTIFKNQINTNVGKAYTALTFCHPITDTSILKDRAQTISYLSNHTDLTKHLDSFLQQISLAEEQSLVFWHSKPVANQQLLQSAYFGNFLKMLNTNTVALEGMGRSLLLLQAGLNLSFFPIQFANAAYQISSSANISFNEGCTALLSFLNQKTTPQQKAGIIAALSVMQASMTYPLYCQFKSTTAIYTHVQNIMIATASHIDGLKKISSLLNKDKELLTYLPSLQPLADFNNPAKRSAKVNKLLSMLDTNTFKGESSFFSVTGRVLAAYELMKQVKDELAPAFAAAGELDMYIALAKLYNSHEDKAVRYCMVNFVEDSTTPIINASNFWNPFINPNAVIANTITFDPSCPNSILTGPNTGGKSTVIKALMLNILMAQTFGIAPSENLTITPFAKLSCFMNIADDIATGTSLFKSEVKRAKKLLELVQALKTHEFSFVIIDEVFTGTSPQEGEAAALRFAKYMGTYTNNISIIATHYPKMVDLETETDGIFHNHHVEILRNEDGSLNRTFKLKNGPTFFNVAFDILEEEGLFV